MLYGTPECSISIIARRMFGDTFYWREHDTLLHVTNFQFTVKIKLIQPTGPHFAEPLAKFIFLGYYWEQRNKISKVSCTFTIEDKTFVKF